MKWIAVLLWFGAVACGIGAALAASMPAIAWVVAACGFVCPMMVIIAEIQE